MNEVMNKAMDNLLEKRANTDEFNLMYYNCLLYTSPSPRDYAASRMPSSA